MNKVILIGNLGKDPELKYVGENALCKFSLATTEHVKGEKKVEWHNIIVWGKTAENVSSYLSKGSQCAIDGRIQTRSYDDKEGVKRYMTEIVAFKVEFLGGRNDNQQGGRPQQNRQQEPDKDTWVGSNDYPESDIPF